MAGHAAAEHSGWRRLCICVDDFGLHGGINRAALALAEAGRVHAVSAMVGGPAWAEGAAALRRADAARLDVGLHLDLTECPLQPALRRPLRSLIASAYLRRLDADALRAEVRLQLDAFEQAMGRPPAYVDGHQHVHQLPVVREVLLAELLRRDGPRPWLRATRGPRAPGAHPDAATRFKAAVIECLGAAGLRVLARREGLAQNAHLLGVYDFRGGAPRYRRLLAGWLRAACNGDLLMCHAGLPDARGAAADPLEAARSAEFEVLSSADLPRLLADLGIRLGPLA